MHERVDAKFELLLHKCPIFGHKILVFRTSFLPANSAGLFRLLAIHLLAILKQNVDLNL